jgi:PASTA domain
VQSITSPVADAGVVATINDPAPTSDRWNVASVEILAGNVAAPPDAAPDVAGLTEAAAAAALDGAGLGGNRHDRDEHDRAGGLVISQNPIGGTQVASGSTVALVVSESPHAGTAVTINDTAPDSDRWKLAAVEIVAR